MDGIIFRTTDPARWGDEGGLGAGGTLTAQQFDENNWELLTRIVSLEDNPPSQPYILGFNVVGSQFIVNMSDSNNFGPYDLPIATFRDVGIWTNSLPLLVLDFFEVPHRGLYRTLIAHTTPSTGDFDPDATDTDSGSDTFGDPLYALVFGEDVYIYDVGFFFPGTPGIGITITDEMFAHSLERNVTMPADLDGSICRLKAPCTADMSMVIKKNNTDIGFAKIDAGDTEGYFEFADDVEFVGGTDDIAVMPPATADATAKGLRITFKMTRTDI